MNGHVILLFHQLWVRGGGLLAKETRMNPMKGISTKAKKTNYHMTC